VLPQTEEEIWRKKIEEKLSSAVIRYQFSGSRFLESGSRSKLSAK
jgi:hypothetical protein